MSQDKPIEGLAQAIARYGAPVERSLVYQVSEETFCYWERTRQKRVAEVVLLLRCSKGRYLVHTKSFYPQGSYRLLSGGIKMGEELLAAVRREALEETGMEVRIERFLGILCYRFVWGGRSVPFTSYLFGVAGDCEAVGSLDLSRPQASEENISAYRQVSLEELGDIANALEALPPDWIEWGRFRAAAHRLAIELLERPGGDRGKDGA